MIIITMVVAVIIVTIAIAVLITEVQVVKQTVILQTNTEQERPNVLTPAVIIILHLAEIPIVASHILINAVNVAVI